MSGRGGKSERICVCVCVLEGKEERGGRREKEERGRERERERGEIGKEDVDGCVSFCIVCLVCDCVIFEKLGLRGGRDRRRRK